MFYQITALFIWSSAFVAAKYTYGMMDAVMMVQMRLVISALVVLPVCRRYLGRIPRQSWKPLVLLSFLNYIGVLMFQFVGLKYTSAASAITVVGLEPLITAFIGHFFFRDPARWYHWLCGLLAFTGVGLMIAGGSEGGGDITWYGCLLVLLGGAVFCATLRPTRKLIDDIGAPAYTSVSLALAALLCLPFTLLLAQDYAIRWSGSGTLALLYLGIGAGWFAYLLWNRGMKQVSANTSGLLLPLEPVFGVILAVLLLGEQISALSWSGVLLVMLSTAAAILLSEMAKRKRTKAA